jgi:hydrogenase nickel incorporation protein HypA/HybF
MHEFSIAQSMLETVLDQARAHGAARVARLVVRAGALSGVVPEALTFAFEALSAGTPAAGAELVVESVPLVCYCAACAMEFAADGYDYFCPRCGVPSREVRKGRELDLVSIEVT